MMHDDAKSIPNFTQDRQMNRNTLFVLSEICFVPRGYQPYSNSHRITFHAPKCDEAFLFLSPKLMGTNNVEALACREGTVHMWVGVLGQ